MKRRKHWPLNLLKIHGHLIKCLKAWFRRRSHIESKGVKHTTSPENYIILLGKFFYFMYIYYLLTPLDFSIYLIIYILTPLDENSGSATYGFYTTPKTWLLYLDHNSWLKQHDPFCRVILANMSSSRLVSKQLEHDSLRNVISTEDETTNTLRLITK